MKVIRPMTRLSIASQSAATILELSKRKKIKTTVKRLTIAIKFPSTVMTSHRNSETSSRTFSALRRFRCQIEKQSTPSLADFTVNRDLQSRNFIIHKKTNYSVFAPSSPSPPSSLSSLLLSVVDFSKFDIYTKSSYAFLKYIESNSFDKVKDKTGTKNEHSRKEKEKNNGMTTKRSRASQIFEIFLSTQRAVQI